MIAQPSSVLGPTPPAALARIIHDLTEAGVKLTPLSIICRATDQGLGDAEIAAMLDKIDAALPAE